MVVGPIHSKIVEQINPNQICFHDLRAENKMSMTPPLRSIVLVRVVRRLQDLYYRQAARRQALSRGRGFHDTLPSALRVYRPGYAVLATSIGTRIRCTRGCWDARCDCSLDVSSSIYLVPLIYVVLFPCFGNNQQYQPRYLCVPEDTTPYTSPKYQARLYRVWCPHVILFILYDLLYPATPQVW